MNDLQRRFACELGYFWCPICSAQLPANLYCESCEDFAWAHPVIPYSPGTARMTWDISDDEQSGRIAA